MRPPFEPAGDASPPSGPAGDVTVPSRPGGAAGRARGRPRIVVGMSGGVDSSLAAALLVEEGYEVVGVTMRLAGSASRCCSLDDADDARRVAERLGIRFYVADYADRFREEVIEPFADAYLAGRTPIPCVACNRRFKFHHLRARARALGAEAVATGHYARVQCDPRTGARSLHRGVDPGKDQSYFLFDLGPEELAGARFPLGHLTKAEVRARARALGLATADKPESQEICFVPDGDYARVVEAVRPDRLPGAGEVVDGEGRVRGRHDGIHRFTVGQRKGLGLPDGPWYVRALDPARNRVVVGRREELDETAMEVCGVSWVAGAPPAGPVRAQVQVRHRHPAVEALVTPTPDGGARVRFEAPVAAITPGQAAAFYAGDRVLGGGWIASSGPGPSRVAEAPAAASAAGGR